MLVAAILGVGLVTIGYLVLVRPASSLALGPADRSKLTLADIPFNGAEAYKYLEQICAIGPRMSGSPGMQAQQQMLAEHFRKLGGQVRFQEFRAAIRSTARRCRWPI